MINCIENNSGRPVYALAVKKVNHSLTDTLKSRARLKKNIATKIMQMGATEIL